MYPTNLILDNKPCAIIGGGGVALQKIRSLLEAAAIVTVIAPAVIPEIRQLYLDGQIQWQKKNYESGDVAAFDLIICAADDPEVNKLASQEAKNHHILVNVCDEPALCTFTSPAVMHQGDLTITISTNGKSPALAAWLKHQLAQDYGPIYHQWLQHLARLRQEVRQALPTSQERQIFWRSVLTDEVMELVRQKKLEEAEAQIRHAISSIRLKS